MLLSVPKGFVDSPDSTGPPRRTTAAGGTDGPFGEGGDPACDRHGALAGLVFAAPDVAAAAVGSRLVVLQRVADSPAGRLARRLRARSRVVGNRPATRGAAHHDRVSRGHAGAGCTALRTRRTRELGTG